MCAYVTEGRLDEAIAALAARQYGVVERMQLYALGASRAQIGHRLHAERLLPLYRGVYAVGHAVLRAEGRWLAATMAYGPRAVLSHGTAAALWELRPRSDGRTHITVPSKRTRRPGTVLHRSPTVDATQHRGIPVTTVPRTLADLAGTVSRPVLQRALEAAETRRLLDVPRVLQAAEGRPGAAAVRDLLAAELPFTRSDFEALVLDLCRRRNLPEPAMNAKVGRHEVDCYWPEHRLIVEADSFAHHGTRPAFERDRERDVELARSGYRVLRFTYRQATTRRGWLGDGIAAALSRAPAAARPQTPARARPGTGSARPRRAA